MILNGLVLSSQVLNNTFYDQMTGEVKPSNSVKLTLLDADTDEKYECQFNSGFPVLEEIKELRRLKAAQDQIDDALARLEASFPPKMTPLTVEVVRIKGKGSFHTLSCRFMRVSATV